MGLYLILHIYRLTNAQLEVRQEMSYQRIGPLTSVQLFSGPHFVKHSYTLEFFLKEPHGIKTKLRK